MQQLPLFHTIAGQPVIVLGQGDMAEPKRRLVERAGGRVVDDLQEGVDEGARLAFVAHDDAAMCEADAIRLRCAGLLVNVVDRPDLCDFTTPSVLDRDPVLVAVGTGGASAGLAKQLRLRLERLLPADLGELARGLYRARNAIRSRFPRMAERRRALDDALGEGGALDPLRSGSVDRVEDWLNNAEPESGRRVHTFAVDPADPEQLTLYQARVLGSADIVVASSAIAPSIINRARADAVRMPPPVNLDTLQGVVVILNARA